MDSLNNNLINSYPTLGCQMALKWYLNLGLPNVWPENFEWYILTGHGKNEHARYTYFVFGFE